MPTPRASGSTRHWPSETSVGTPASDTGRLLCQQPQSNCNLSEEEKKSHDRKDRKSVV
jgi:hypothetical protein